MITALHQESITTRLLPASEWAKLEGTELASVWRHLDPLTGSVIVAERGDQVVGCWSVFPAFHVEGVWIDPQERKRGGVARRLLGRMLDHLRERKITHVLTAALGAEVEGIIAHLDADELPGKHYVWRVN